MNKDKDMTETIQIVYDGECPFCRHYCRMVRLKKSAGDIELVDARRPSALMDDITAMGLDIDQGMVVKMQGKIYYGAEAIHVLALPSTRSGLFNRMNYHVFQSEKGAKFLYPLLRDGRNVALWLLGKSRIDNLGTGRTSWIGGK
tara:strand:- start:1650 stop:2081 length:432 start_codon:yes stop_codon:yes gene_type:complete